MILWQYSMSVVRLSSRRGHNDTHTSMICARHERSRAKQRLIWSGHGKQRAKGGKRDDKEGRFRDDISHPAHQGSGGRRRMSSGVSLLCW